MNIVTYAAFSYLITAVIAIFLACLIVVLNKYIGGDSAEEVTE